MTFQTRQETLDFIEKVVTDACGVQKQSSYEAIAFAVDNYVDKFLRQLQEEHKEGVREITNFVKTTTRNGNG